MLGSKKSSNCDVIVVVQKKKKKKDRLSNRRSKMATSFLGGGKRIWMVNGICGARSMLEGRSNSIHVMDAWES
jgi:hypothetical protein